MFRVLPKASCSHSRACDNSVRPQTWKMGIGGQPYRRLLPGATRMQRPRTWVRVMWEVPQVTCVTLEKSPFF